MSTPALALATSYPLTDAGNAERFVVQNQWGVRYVHGWDRWLVTNGAKWAQDDRREVYRRAIVVVRSILSFTEEASPEAFRAAAKHVLQSERRDRLEAMLALARTMPPLAVVPDDLDADPYLLNCPNGTLRLSDGRFLRHEPDQLLTKCTGVAYDPSAPAPTWDAFLSRVLPDPDLRAYVRRAVGYSLTGDVSEHALFFLYGLGANGKSTFLEILRELLGEGEYAKAAAPDLLLAKRNDRHAVEVADLQGVRFVTTIEAGEGRAWDEARVKWLTGGDAISARFMYGNPFTFTPTHKFWIASNHRPRVSGTDHGFWRRVHLIPFTVTIPADERDPQLREKLRAELPGILRWAVAGALEWRTGRLRAPPAVLSATAAYKSAEDVLGAFLEESCALGAGHRVLVGALYDTFRAWAERSGERDMTKRAFGDALEERGIERKSSNGQRWFIGIGLKGEG